MPVKFGAHYSGGISKAEVVAYAQRLVSLGFDGLWVTEGARSREPLTVLAAAGAACNLDLGTAVLLAPFRHPTLLAREIATLDVMTGGKVILGVGVGGERAADFGSYGAAVNERGARANEVLAVMLRLWQEREVSHSGRFFQIESATLDVRPLQKPHPPVWIGGRLGGEGKTRDAALRRAARYGDGWLPYLVTPEQYSAGLQRLAEYAKEYGRDPGLFARPVQVYVGLARTRHEALATALEVTGRTYSLSESQVERFCAAGTPDDVTRRLQEYIAAGAEYFVIQWSCRGEEVPANLDLLAQEVIPALRGT
jgi:alkanesulfonate monooxygenase SsuD/methylene tetrahydromethanopterin reductase-like flavin-dependent oxidoreductase (luciferase family)